jgi:isoleucyl-tRNA synthetase
VLDEKGRKMSKSLGNVIAPQNLIKEYGADVVRLWAASVDSREDMPVSKETLTRTAESYRKIRNTLRFLLSNLGDFDPDRDALPLGELLPVDAYMLRSARALAKRIEQAYRDYEFHVVYHALNNFCAVNLSAVYLDLVKDRLYCSAPSAPGRRSAQTALYRTARMVATAMAPVLVFTADEAWEHLAGDTAGGVHTQRFELLEDFPDDEDADWRFARLAYLRDEVLKELEVHRQEGEFGKPLEAEVVLGGERAALDADLAACRTSLQELCIVSQVVPGDATFESRAYPGLLVGVRRTEGTTCPRCWQVWPQPAGHPQHPDLCARCLDVVLSLGERQPR